MPQAEPKTSRGQLSSTDGMFGLTGLMMVLLLSLSLFYLLYNQVSTSMLNKEMELKSYYAMEQLLSQGSPADWQALNSSAISNYGIESESGILDASKLSALGSANYSLVKDRIGLSKYNFSLTVSDYYNGSALYSIGSVNRSNSLTIQRISSMGGSLMLVQLKVSR